MEIVVERLQGHNIKPSVQRIAIMKYLSKTTVYNTLKILSEQGAAQTLTIDERNTCYDADTTPHAHFLCKRCGKVYDLACNDTVRQVVDTDMDGHEVQETHYYYKGICKQCKED